MSCVTISRFAIPVAALGLVLACSDGSTSATDAGAALDAASEDARTLIDAASNVDAAITDASSVDDAGGAADAGPVDAGGLASECTGACATLALDAMIGSGRGGFDRAYYGISAAITTGGAPELYLEAYAGGADGCPTMSSPTPRWTLILSGVLLPIESSAPITLGDGVSVSIVDFEGHFRPTSPNPLIRATGGTITPVAANVCPSCVGQPAPADPEGFVSLDLAITFDDGALTGHIYATHCDSLDG